MIVDSLNSIFIRDLDKLKKEIEQYRSESNLWITEKEIANSAGNLCLHLIGNLNTFIGAEIGKSGYERQRANEFGDKNTPREDLLRMIAETKVVISQSLSNISDDDLSNEYPILVFQEKTSFGYFLIHLTTHLTYHLGQINYHRRLLDA